MDKDAIIAALLDVVRCTYHAMENTEHDDDGMHWLESDFDALSAAMDKLDALPDDRPGYVMGPAAKAGWALQQLAAPAAPRLVFCAGCTPSDCTGCLPGEEVAAPQGEGK